MYLSDHAGNESYSGLKPRFVLLGNMFFKES